MGDYMEYKKTVKDIQMEELFRLGVLFRKGIINREECFAGHCNLKDRKRILEFYEGMIV
jgi:hypothetical protein